MIDTTGSWLIQRLLRAPEATDKGDFIAKARQAFGGGALGLGDEARMLLRNVFDFDGMGAAEYEFGKIPQKLNDIVQNRGAYVAFMTTVSGKDIAPGWCTERISLVGSNSTTGSCSSGTSRPGRRPAPCSTFRHRHQEDPNG